MTIDAIFSIPEIFSARRSLCIQPHYDDNDIAAARIVGVKEQYWRGYPDVWLTHEGNRDHIQRETLDKEQELAGA